MKSRIKDERRVIQEWDINLVDSCTWNMVVKDNLGELGFSSTLNIGMGNNTSMIMLPICLCLCTSFPSLLSNDEPSIEAYISCSSDGTEEEGNHGIVSMTYNSKHNLANGEDNNDSENHNNSCKYGQVPVISLQQLTGKAIMLTEIINYVQSLQHQVKVAALGEGVSLEGKLLSRLALTIEIFSALKLLVYFDIAYRMIEVIRLKAKQLCR
uniref:Uncharacterized protein n=1 Tax=Cucumis melo TaxID=3656 RepID=A0A9I9EGB4_CUCME